MVTGANSFSSGSARFHALSPTPGCGVVGEGGREFQQFITNDQISQLLGKQAVDLQADECGVCYGL
jgi:hypothetical protein